MNMRQAIPDSVTGRGAQHRTGPGRQPAMAENSSLSAPPSPFSGIPTHAEQSSPVVPKKPADVHGGVKFGTFRDRRETTCPVLNMGHVESRKSRVEFGIPIEEIDPALMHIIRRKLAPQIPQLLRLGPARGTT